MADFNIYCDESNHLERGEPSVMVLGAIYCLATEVRDVNKRIREIAQRHKLAKDFEIKWTKVSQSKLQFYLDLVDYFFDYNDLHFRGVVIDKSQLNHERYGQTHDEWYYKMYFELLTKILNPEDTYAIYLDIKDSNGSKKVRKLHQVLCSEKYDFEQKIITKVQQVRSHELSIIQLTDLLIGALQFANRSDLHDKKNLAKVALIKRIRERSGYALDKSTLVKEPKMNIFHWKGHLG